MQYYLGCQNQPQSKQELCFQADLNLSNHEKYSRIQKVIQIQSPRIAKYTFRTKTLIIIYLIIGLTCPFENLSRHVQSRVSKQDFQYHFLTKREPNQNGSKFCSFLERDLSCVFCVYFITTIETISKLKALQRSNVLFSIRQKETLVKRLKEYIENTLQKRYQCSFIGICQETFKETFETQHKFVIYK